MILDQNGHIVPDEALQKIVADANAPCVKVYIDCTLTVPKGHWLAPREPLVVEATDEKAPPA